MRPDRTIMENGLITETNPEMKIWASLINQRKDPEMKRRQRKERKRKCTPSAERSYFAMLRKR